MDILFCSTKFYLTNISFLSPFNKFPITAIFFNINHLDITELFPPNTKIIKALFSHFFWFENISTIENERILHLFNHLIKVR